MKKLLFLLLVAAIFQSCEDTETNSPALQANLNASFFKAYSASAIADNTDQMMTITGTSDHQEFSLHTRWLGQKNYEVGANSVNYATFKTAEGKIYTTNTPGSFGAITIKTEDKENQLITGSFDFSFITAVDTIAVHKGFFFAVPYQIMDVVPD
jgi:hypothetical protein